MSHVGVCLAKCLPHGSSFIAIRLTPAHLRHHHPGELFSRTALKLFGKQGMRVAEKADLAARATEFFPQ